jgi:hypothetical protein
LCMFSGDHVGRKKVYRRLRGEDLEPPRFAAVENWCLKKWRIQEERGICGAEGYRRTDNMRPRTQ